MSGTLVDSSGTPLVNQTLGINVNSNIIYTSTNELGSYAANYPLVSNYNLGISNISIIFNETDWYLGNTENNSFVVSGRTTFEDVVVEGDWFNNQLRRGGEIDVYRNTSR